jgi:hypothetical protein
MRINRKIVPTVLFSGHGEGFVHASAAVVGAANQCRFIAGGIEGILVRVVKGEDKKSLLPTRTRISMVSPVKAKTRTKISRPS